MQFPHLSRRVRNTVLWAALLLAANTKATSAPAEPKTGSTWPQGYSVQRDEAVGVLRLSTPWYMVEQDLRRGGAISRIMLQYGKAKNLLAHHGHEGLTANTMMEHGANFRRCRH